MCETLTLLSQTSRFSLTSSGHCYGHLLAQHTADSPGEGEHVSRPAGEAPGPPGSLGASGSLSWPRG